MGRGGGGKLHAQGKRNSKSLSGKKKIGYHRKVSRKCTINLLSLLQHLAVYLPSCLRVACLLEREQIMIGKRMTSLH